MECIDAVWLSDVSEGSVTSYQNEWTPLEEFSVFSYEEYNQRLQELLFAAWDAGLSAKVDSAASRWSPESSTNYVRFILQPKVEEVKDVVL